MASKGKILALISSVVAVCPLKDGKIYTGAGYYLNEVTVPVRALDEGGLRNHLSANPTGNTPQVDVHSEVVGFFGGDAAKLQDYLLFRRRLAWACRDPVPASGMSSRRAWINMTLFSFRAAMARRA